MPTIKDVAKEANVSIATVSYVLNNKSNSISVETRNLVLETAERIGYTPNVTARNFRFSQTRLIGYAWHEVPREQVNPVMDRFTYHLAHAAEESGYHVLTFTHPADDPVPVYDELIRTRRLDAFVLSQTQQHDPRVDLLLKQGFPFVSFGRSGKEDRYSWVDIDGSQGVYDAVTYLVGLGHRKIAMVAWDHIDSGALNHRLTGYRRALTDANIPVHPDYIYYGDHSELTGHKALAHWCNLPTDEQPTAVFAVSDLEAIGVMNEAEERGLVVGEDISVIGFDDVPMSQFLRPALTTVRQPIPEVAGLVVDMLNSILSKEGQSVQGTLLQPELIVRKSCSPPKAIRQTV